MAVKICGLIAVIVFIVLSVNMSIVDKKIDSINAALAKSYCMNVEEGVDYEPDLTN